ncbi:MAG: bifunctional methylenetetrahydrofolate dehydrogenase/methenyltetrahydrofolate cyclohydrolase FolD [Oligoflexales bacterium]|nr:bifunctional methylenetetrahydrofolate dehydrogenase/methenyltetrahydrofolate cyclohydrolase FolD [Oligoflexales bacterium]
MSAKIIDGKTLSRTIKEEIKTKIESIVSRNGRRPSLAVVIVGADPASEIYVSHKEKACNEVGIDSKVIRLEERTSQIQLEEILSALNTDNNINGILLQLPLPGNLSSDRALDCIDPKKDVDGLTPQNQGLLVVKRNGLFPCTPLGCMELIKSTGTKIEGKLAAVIGRSLLVGSPIRTMLTNEGATTFTIHTKTRNPPEITKMADILIAAAGVPELVKGDWVKPGALVIDVGMHRTQGKLTGDVHFESVKDVAEYLTPVPGGVGPMTIAMLLSNCLKAYEMKNISS